MTLATWWQDDPLPCIPPLRVTVIRTPVALPDALGVSAATLEQRLAAGHELAVAWLANIPVASGWVATQVAAIGEIAQQVTLRPTERYLWDFTTLPAFRGRGLYPHLLAAICATAPDVARWWILAAPENLASARGIVHAGFTTVGEVRFHPQVGIGLFPAALGTRSDAGADFLNIPTLPDSAATMAAPCWRCVNPVQAIPERVACWAAQLHHAAICTCGQHQEAGYRRGASWNARICPAGE